MNRPRRISSEAPEVVPRYSDLNVANSPSTIGKSNRKNYEKRLAGYHSPGLDSRSPTPIDGADFETPASGNSPRGKEREYQNPGALYDFSPYGEQAASEPPYQGRRAFGLVTTIILVIVAFIIGGGVGGGVGGAIAVKNKDKSSSTCNTTIPTSTSTSPPSTTTMIVDVAGCPNINKATYNSTITPYTFIQACATQIEAPSGQYIDVANQTESSFDACLDWCAQYTANSSTKGQCVAATWVIFSPADPTMNSRCYLKNSTGNEVPASTGQQVVSGYLNNA